MIAFLDKHNTFEFLEDMFWWCLIVPKSLLGIETKETLKTYNFDPKALQL